jgi:hypothetical protein
LVTLANVARQLPAPEQVLTQSIVHRCESFWLRQSLAHLLLQLDFSAFMQATNFDCAGVRQLTRLRSQTVQSVPNAAPFPSTRSIALSSVNSRRRFVICIPPMQATSFGG